MGNVCRINIELLRKDQQVHTINENIPLGARCLTGHGFSFDQLHCFEHDQKEKEKRTLRAKQVENSFGHLK